MFNYLQEIKKSISFIFIQDKGSENIMVK